MKPRQYQTLPAKQVEGRRVQLTKELKYGAFIVAAGTVATILRKSRGYDLQTDACSTCGVVALLYRVDYTDLELVPLDIAGTTFTAATKPELPTIPNLQTQDKDDFHFVEGPLPENQYGRPLAAYGGFTYWEWEWASWAYFSVTHTDP